MAVPGPVTSAASQGCHRMIREGEARLVGAARDVLEECGPLLAGGDDDRDGLFRRDLDGLSGDMAVVYEALPASDVCDPAMVAESAGLPIERVRAALPLLELDGLVASTDGGWRRT